MVAGAAAAVTAVAAAAVAAMRKVGKHDEPATPEPTTPEPAPQTTQATSPSASVSTAPVGPVPMAAVPAPSAPSAPSAPGAPGAPAPATAGHAPAPAEAGRQGGAWADLPVTPEPDEHADDLITAYPSARPGPAGAIHGVGITILVTDLARSVAFYRDTLGFYEIDRGDGSAVLASGDTRLVLRAEPDLAARSSSQVYLNLEVGDVEAIYNELQAKGVPFVHPPQAMNRGDRLELWSATFNDPDNHNIAISQWRAIR